MNLLTVRDGRISFGNISIFMLLFYTRRIVRIGVVYHWTVTTISPVV